MKKLYTIWDNAAQAILPHIMVFSHDTAAVRMFGDECARKESLISKHIADFELLCLGNIDESGNISHEGPAVVITGKAWLAAQHRSDTDAET